MGVGSDLPLVNSRTASGAFSDDMTDLQPPDDDGRLNGDVLQMTLEEQSRMRLFFIPSNILAARHNVLNERSGIMNRRWM
jgi:hypothetical protein